MKPPVIDRILGEIQRWKSFCVVGHIRPDGDCIGSQLGLYLALSALGRKVTCWNQDPVPAKLKFLDPEREVTPPQADQEFDCVIALDCASIERMGRTASHIQRRQVLINIDHHESNTRYGDINWVSAREASTGELIYQLMQQAKWDISPRIADCLFTAVSTDTGSFQYASTSPATFEAAGRLVERGADLAKVCHEVYQSYPLSRMKLLRRVYNKFRLTHDDRTAYFWIKQADYSRTGAKPADSEGLIDHIRAIDEVVVACVFEEMEPELTRLSLRSKSPRVDVNSIAGQFGGGGHKAAAGARIAGKPVVVQRRVLAAIRKALLTAAKD